MLNPVITLAQAPQDYELAKDLFEEYAQSLAIDLGFQNFAEELAQITTQYSSQNGGIILLKLDNEAIACAGLRRIDAQTAELKRMYIRAGFRGRGLGKILLYEIIKLAQSLAYQSIRLDTLPSMLEAIQLYRALGFYEIAAYRPNPIAGAIYMEIKL
jgi:ribosomal protein S18 acetylase RimI-like enzyme